MTITEDTYQFALNRMFVTPSSLIAMWVINRISITEYEVYFMNYYPPAFLEKQFNCVECEVYARQEWHELVYNPSYDNYFETSMYICCCSHCEAKSFWFEERMVVPHQSIAELPHVDLPDDCLTDFNEAREVFNASPRAAAALLRLVVQKLLKCLGGEGKNINHDIAVLVSQGLPEEVQQALDFSRVIGNNAVHPGEINFDDKPETGLALFSMINFIVENQITQKKRIAFLYAQLPQGALKAIEKRDKTT